MICYVTMQIYFLCEGRGLTVSMQILLRLITNTKSNRNSSYLKKLKKRDSDCVSWLFNDEITVLKFYAKGVLKETLNVFDKIGLLAL